MKFTRSGFLRLSAMRGKISKPPPDPHRRHAFNTMTHFFTDPQFEALSALCDTLLPGLEPPPGADEVTAAYYRRSAADLGIAAEMARAIHDYATPESQQQTKQLLDALAAPFSAGLLTGQFQK